MNVRRKAIVYVFDVSNLFAILEFCVDKTSFIMFCRAKGGTSQKKTSQTVKALRVLRVLRPLKAISKVKKLKVRVLL